MNMAPALSPLFSCDSCAQSIPRENPRVRCTVCPDYDLCANCMLGERFTQSHNISHNVQVFKQSGGADYPSLPASAPSAKQSVSTTPTVPGWKPFFNDDMSPTPTFLSLMNDLFTFLDPANNGNLEPEVLSRLVDDMGQPLHENGWKSALQASGTMSKESNADKALKNIFDLFSIEHVLLLRTRPIIQSQSGPGSRSSFGFGRALLNAALPQVSHQGPMPAITRRGFIEYFTINQLTEPSDEWAALNRALKKYQLPQYASWGDLPRSVLPQMPHPAMVQRVENVKKYSVQKGMERLEAARTAAMIQARANQAAVDAIGNTRTEYIYRY